jgi:succinate dehydrogenase / fumarate reductase flavoprotein subunit
MARTEDGLKKALEFDPVTLREEFWSNSRCSATADSLNQSLEKAGRTADFLELGELMCRDALERASPAAATSAPSSRTRTARPSATTMSSPTSRPGSTPSETGTNDPGMGTPVLHKEDLIYTAIEMKQRSYK